jgi:hypothetical protein
MKLKFDNILWGLLLILAGGLALAQQQGWIGILTPQFWMLTFGVVSLIFFVRYFIAGLRQWGWLFPACIFSALAVILYLSENGVRETWLASPIFIAISIPFLVVFFLDIRKNWWALIPAFIMIVLCLVVIFEASLPGELIGTLIMFSVAIPFALVYLSNRQRNWALIPAFSTAMIGVITLLSMYTIRWVGALVPIAIAIPFFYVYIRNQQHWWAIIPAGVMVSIGINVWFTDPMFGKLAAGSLPTAILFLGWSATFGWLWYQREKFPTQWARIPALVSGIIGIILLVMGSFTEIGLVVILIVTGLVFIYLGLRPRKENLVNKEN